MQTTFLFVATRHFYPAIYPSFYPIFTLVSILLYTAVISVCFSPSVHCMFVNSSVRLCLVILMILAISFYRKSLYFVFPTQEPRISTGPQACWGYLIIYAFAMEMNVKIVRNGSKSILLCYLYPGALWCRCKILPIHICLPPKKNIPHRPPSLLE